MKKNLFILVVIGVFCITGVLASFNYHGANMKTSYSTGELITGTVNLSFKEEKANDKITSNFDGGTTLLQWIRDSGFDEGIEYNCTSNGCVDYYTPGDAISSLSLSNESIVGFKVVGGSIQNVKSASFTIASDIGPSCYSQLGVDILNNGDNILTNTKHTSQTCFSKNYGCFSTSLNSYLTGFLSDINPFCGNITLPAAPAYSIGGRVINSTNGNSGAIVMELRDISGTVLGSCTLPNMTSSAEERSCVVEYSSPKQQNYLVCMKRGNNYKQGSVPNYGIRYEAEGKICGTDDPFSNVFTRDYEIFGQSMEFDSVSFVVNDTTFNSLFGDSLSNVVMNYIIDEHNGKCTPSCVVPIRLEGLNQQIILSNVVLRYVDGNTETEINNLNSAKLEASKITSGRILLDLGEANFTIPSSTSEKKFKLIIGGSTVFEKTVNITKGFSFEVKPTFVTLGRTTTLTAVTSENVTSSEWDFGDKVETSNGKSIEHRFTKSGNVDIKVTLTNSKGKESSKTVRITVGDPESAANETIVDYNERIQRLKTTLQAYPDSFESAVSQEIGLQDMEVQLGLLEERYDNAEGEDNFTEIVLDLIELNVPAELNVTKKGSVPLVSGFESIDVSSLEALSNDDIDDSILQNQVAGWMQESIDATLNYEELSAFYDEGVEPVASKFVIDVRPKEAANAYLFFAYPVEGLVFGQNYGAKNVEGGSYIPVSGNLKVEVYVLDDLEPEELGAYVSPLIEDLGISAGEVEEYTPKGFRWSFFFMALIILIIIALAIYIFLQQWYKKNYERSLFRNEDDLYNLITFIHNARESGLDDNSIRAKLKGSQWSGEQITYSFRKLDGKRTGMYELPFMRFFDRRKTQQEIEKRQEGRKVY